MSCGNTTSLVFHADKNQASNYLQIAFDPSLVTSVCILSLRD